MDSISERTLRIFGTDGIRGTPGLYPLDDSMLERIARATASRLKKGRRKHSVVIGKDTRASGSSIESVMTRAFTSSGISVHLAGTITTPGLSFLVPRLKASAGIMISASHNKPSDNGIKFFNSLGEKLAGDEEEAIEDLIFSPPPGPLSQSVQPPAQFSAVPDAIPEYVKFLSSTASPVELTGLRVALDCAWGAASGFAAELFRSLGAFVTPIHDTPSADSINDGGAVKPQLLRELVLSTQSDIGVAVDGDGDRGILIDEKGTILDGDCILAVVGRHLLASGRLPGKTIVTTVMSNLGLRESIESAGGLLLVTPVGDKHVLRELLKNDLMLGGEQSGHVIFRQHLCTPDGLLTAIQMMKVMKETSRPLSELASCMRRFPQILVNVPVREKVPFEEIPGVDAKMRFFTSQLKNSGRILLRYSGTELLARVMVEGRDMDTIRSIAEEIAGAIRQAIGKD